MLHMFYVGDKFRILVTKLAVLVINILYLFTAPVITEIDHQLIIYFLQKSKFRLGLENEPTTKSDQNR